LDGLGGGGGGGFGGHGGMLGGSDYVSGLSEEDRIAYLEELQAQMSVLMPELSSRQRVLSMEDVGPSAVFPQLSLLNKDDMLSHAMTVPILLPDDGTPFTIGRNGGARENDFVLNGVGIQVKGLGAWGWG
jgi:hypothetical protein